MSGEFKPPNKKFKEKGTLHASQVPRELFFNRNNSSQSKGEHDTWETYRARIYEDYEFTAVVNRRIRTLELDNISLKQRIEKLTSDFGVAKLH